MRSRLECTRLLLELLKRREKLKRQLTCLDHALFEAQLRVCRNTTATAIPRACMARAAVSAGSCPNGFLTHSLMHQGNKQGHPPSPAARAGQT
eukprot:scaffold13003_cov73-Isochrysis_galbana.AAC.1